MRTSTSVAEDNELEKLIRYGPVICPACGPSQAVAVQDGFAAIVWVRKNFQPEGIFDEEKLITSWGRAWAKSSGEFTSWVKPSEQSPEEGVEYLVKTLDGEVSPYVHSFDGQHRLFVSVVDSIAEYLLDEILEYLPIP